MSKPIRFIPNPFPKTALLLATVLCAGLPAFAQDDQTAPPTRTELPPEVGPAPDFIPPPPPDFEMPEPPALPGSPGPDSAPPRVRPQAATPSAPPSQAELLQRPSGLVDQADPQMQETVGLIRIPEMGTNEVLEMLENFTAKPILRQQTLPSVKITFFSQGALTRGEAITAIESLLALNGIAITNVGEKFLKAVPSAIINTQVPRVWEGTTLDAVPSQMIYEKIFELDFLTTDEASTLIQPLMTQGAPLGFEKSNLILVTDSLINLQRIERLLPILDRPARLRTEMLFFELSNIEAEEVVRRVQQLIQGPLRRQLENNTSIEGDQRTNQVVVFTHPSNVELVTELIERLDIDVAPTTATKVYSIRYADATEVVNIIDQIVTGQRQVRQETGGTDAQAAAAARQRAAQIQRANQAVAAARAEASNLQFSDFLTIVPDERANTIVANGTNSDLKYLEQLIEEIDTLLAQVRIEVVITEVTLTDNDTRGIDNFGFTYSGTGFDVDLDGTGETTWTASPGNLYGISFGNGVSWGPNEAFSFDFILTTAATNSNVKVLSAPTIVTTHNKEASVSVGQERPVITGSTSSELTGSTTIRDQVQYRDIKLELTVTPLIGSDGIVQLELEQQIQNIIGEILVNENPQPIVGTKSATSYVSVEDGGLIALGGLQSLDSTDTRGKMAVLGRIPVLGNLFRSKNISSTRTELLIFIKPTILRTARDADRDANELIEVLEGSERVRDYLKEGTFRETGKKKPEPEEADEDATSRRGQRKFNR